MEEHEYMKKLRRAAAMMTVLTLVVLMGMMLTGCPEDLPEIEEVPPPEEVEVEMEPEVEPVEDPEAVTEDVDGDRTIVTIETSHGEMTAELYDEKMPITAGSFLLLVEDGFYDNLTFHRVVPDFVIQGGDPAGDGTGGPGFEIPLENPGLIEHERGVLSMARSQALDSAGSQFFVCLSNDASVRALDTLGGGYAAFGKVTEGMEVADQVRVGDAILSITLESESLHADAAREAALEARIPVRN